MVTLVWGRGGFGGGVPPPLVFNYSKEALGAGLGLKGQEPEVNTGEGMRTPRDNNSLASHNQSAMTPLVSGPSAHWGKEDTKPGLCGGAYTKPCSCVYGSRSPLTVLVLTLTVMSA